MARKQGSHATITGPKVRRAALTLFAAHGYAAVSMRQIAASVGVQAGALYLYTPDKQTLLFDLMQAHMDDLLVASEVPEGTAEAQLEAFVRFHIRYHLDRPELVFIAYMELRNLTDENFAVIEGLRKRYETRLEDILRQGRETGVFGQSDDQVSAVALIAMLTGVTTWYRDDGRLSRDAVADIYCDMALGAVRG